MLALPSVGLVGARPAGILLLAGRGILHFLTPLKRGQRLGQLLPQGKFSAGAKLQYIKERFDDTVPPQSFPMATLRHAAARGSEERLQMCSVLLKS